MTEATRAEEIAERVPLSDAGCRDRSARLEVPETVDRKGRRKNAQDEIARSLDSAAPAVSTGKDDR